MTYAIENLKISLDDSQAAKDVLPLTITAPVTHQEIAVVLAIWGMFSFVESSIGSSITGGTWNNVFLPTLHRNLPDGSKG